MEQQTYEQTENVAQATEVENKEQGAVTNEVSYGKFKDAKSLLTAYEKLEAEFTRRSQRLKELEAGAYGDGKETTEKASLKVGNKSGEELSNGENNVGKTESVDADTCHEKINDNKGELTDTASSSTKVEDGENDIYSQTKGEIIREYLKDLIKTKPAVDFGGGVAVVAPPKKPKTLEEASTLFKEYIKMKGETL